MEVMEERLINMEKDAADAPSGEKKLLGAVHSVESFGSVDGPGTRFLIFLKGCAMRCRYCHNPDTWDYHSEDMRSADSLLDQAERYREYWGEDGGITVSGGDPLIQIDFVLQLFEEAKRRGINTCLDTSAQPFTRKEPFFGKFTRLMKLTDTVLLDIKEIDSRKHRWLTGWGNENILDCARYLSETGVPVWIRHVLVPGVTDRDEELRSLKSFIDSLHNVKKVEILPYHTLGVYKYEKLGIPYRLPTVNPPTEQEISHAKKILGIQEAKN